MSLKTIRGAEIPLTNRPNDEDICAELCPQCLEDINSAADVHTGTNRRAKKEPVVRKPGAASMEKKV